MMIRKTYSRRNSGMTLMETVISMGVAAFVFATAGFLIFVSSRNCVNIRDQILAQTSASSGAERIANIMRRATYFVRYNGDNATTVTRFMAWNADTATTACVCHDQVK